MDAKTKEVLNTIGRFIAAFVILASLTFSCARCITDANKINNRHEHK